MQSFGFGKKPSPGHCDVPVGELLAAVVCTVDALLLVTGGFVTTSVTSEDVDCEVTVLSCTVDEGEDVGDIVDDITVVELVEDVDVTGVELLDDATDVELIVDVTIDGVSVTEGVGISDDGTVDGVPVPGGAELLDDGAGDDTLVV